MHILITRPLEDSKDLIIKFQNLGHKVSHFPVIKIESKKHDEINFDEFAGIIFTSSNAVKNLNLKKIIKNIAFGSKIFIAMGAGSITNWVRNLN